MKDIKNTLNDHVFASDLSEKVNFSDFSKKKFIIYFYPKDDTPGCTKEAIDFQKFQKDFKKLGYSIIGVSKDNVEKHKKFKKKHNFDFELFSDLDGKICETFGVWVEKSMYGKKYMGIERSTFIVHEDFEIKKSWKKVKVNGHVEEVLNFIQNLN